MSAPSFSVADLRARPDFAPAVADRVWRAWWKPKGGALAPIESFVRSTLAADLVPSALVAHDGPDYLGSAQEPVDRLALSCGRVSAKA